ncbi:hypothetical protein FIU87_12980 [Bacillus sp. THAF10]|uniref:DUF3221 domain-containing protein n=1 Tax=Bacillus sp. THAF10 TaxID=2587848 RepID=UPI001268E951|nr:DUF3221 domain-containing protein [Bacillus sp. THAF10]QFT89567.1 hypothetical protein FIU87_12980 [Bacillus sp. THAF10]
MIKKTPHKKILLLSMLILVFFVLLNGVNPQKNSSVDLTKLPDDYFTIDGYIASKRLDSIWVSEQPVSYKLRVLGYVTSDYGEGTIVVSQHPDSEEQDIFSTLKTNQKVRIYGDYLRESSPPKIAAYYIEIIDN